MRTAIFSSIDGYNILGSSINNNLYQIYYSMKPTHAIFHANMITPEIMQFIGDFSDKVKCYLYHDVVSSDIVNHFQSYNIQHLTYDTTQPNAVHLPSDLIDTKLFHLNTNIATNDGLVCFIDRLPILPDFLKNHLYPKSTLPIKLFNNPYIQHPQNLGLLNESDKALVLQNHKYYLVINDNDEYIREAQNCGCIVVNIRDIENYESLSYVKPESYTDFSKFFKDNIV
jgi:hypothetical protein